MPLCPLYEDPPENKSVGYMFAVLCFNKNPSFIAVPLLFHIIIATADILVFIILWLSPADRSVTVFPYDNHLSVCGHKDLASATKTYDNRLTTHFPGKIALRVGQNRRLYGTRTQNDTRKVFYWHSAFTAVSVVFISSARPASSCCEEYVRIYTHLSA